jgi:HPt (histidine-containing phosphotransfer) domain-containing protein
MSNSLNMTNLNAELDIYPVINVTNLEKLKKSTQSNPEYLIEIFISFVDDSLELISEMETGLTENNFEMYYDAVHALKGLAGTIGFSRMFQLLKIMDSHNKEENFELSANYIAPLKRILDDIKLFLNKEFAI